MSYDIKYGLHNANVTSLLNDVISQINGQGNFQILGNPTLAIGSSSKLKVKNSAFDVIRDGVLSTIASTETDFTATTHDVADGKEAKFNVYLDASNVITLLKGDDATSSSVCPDTPAGGLKIGEVKIAVTGAIFDATTDELDEAHITDTYTNATDVMPETDALDGKYFAHQKALANIIDEMRDTMLVTGVARLLDVPTLVIGTSSKAKIKHSAFDYVKDGVFGTISGGEVAFTATTHDLADGDGAVYLVYLDGTTVKISKGTATTGGTGAVCPTTPAGMTKLGEVKIVTSGAIFDATTTELDAVTITDTYTDKTDVYTDFDLGDEGRDYLYQKNLLDLFEDMEAQLNVVNNARVLSNPTLVIGTSSAAKVKHSTFLVVRDGIWSSITGGEVAFTATTHDVASGNECVFNIYLVDTTVTILKGTETLIGGGAVCPATPEGGLKVGEVKIESHNALFDATTTLLSATTVVDTYTSKIDVLESIG